MAHDLPACSTRIGTTRFWRTALTKLRCSILPTVHLFALATDFIVLIAVLLLCALTLGGWGRLTLRLLGVATPRVLDTATVWLGFAVICAMVELIQLFAPINWVVSVITIAIGLSAYSFEQLFSRFCCRR